MSVLEWHPFEPFYCPTCDKTLQEAWHQPYGPPVCAECGARVRPSAQLVKWYVRADHPKRVETDRA